MVFIVNRTADIRYGVAFFVLCILLLQTQRLFEEPVCTNNKKTKKAPRNSLCFIIYLSWWAAHSSLLSKALSCVPDTPIPVPGEPICGGVRPRCS